MASGILASGTAEALRQARQAEERLKSDMFGLLRNQEERTKEEMVNLLMQQEAGGKEGSLALGSGALSIQVCSRTNISAILNLHERHYIIINFFGIRN